MNSTSEEQVICAWCFPGLHVINGVQVTHSICAMHKWAKAFEFLFLLGKEHDAWQQTDWVQFRIGMSARLPRANYRVGVRL